MSVDLDAADLIASLDTGSYTVTRRAAATYVNGVAVDGGTSVLTIDASVQPASGRDLERLPEGRRSLETRRIYTTTQLLVGGKAATNEADLVTIDGVQFEVQDVEQWPGSAGFYKALAQRPA